VPKRYQELDPYLQQCHRTAQLVAEKLGLHADSWQVAFQSRFGPEEWLKPYTGQLIEEWGRTGMKSVSVVAPGFAADCLETLDELGREAHEIFALAGGETYRYIPALNDSQAHIDALAEILLAQI
jgi:ferrochelatase